MEKMFRHRESLENSLAASTFAAAAKSAISIQIKP
jgi:hypothetical protein